MRKVIANSTPLIGLCKIGRLDILKTMYGNITVPQAVFDEVTKKNDSAKKQISEATWIHIEAVRETKSKRMYKAKLHEGEVEVMILAQEHDGDHLVIIDDGAARKTAEFLGLNVTGTIGVLIKSKKEGHIKEVMPLIFELEKHGIYFSEALKSRVRRLSGEELKA